MRRRVGRGLLCACAAAALFAAGAPAASTQLPGALYKGTLAGAQSKVSISFVVSTSGRVAGSIHLSRLPLYCPGSAPPSARITFGPGTISSQGAFTAKGRDAIALGPLKGTTVATLTLTGMFGRGHGESGAITTTFVGGGSKCSGRSQYTTKAAA